jgi:threonine/homoserine/homoserine lactone efflux protein
LYDLFLPLVLLILVGNFTPGPNNILASYSGFHFGLKKTIPLIMAVTFGWPALILTTNFVLIFIFRQYPIVQTILEVSGSVFLIYLAYKLSQTKNIEEKELDKPIRFVPYFFFQFINPKGVVTAIIIVTKFIDSNENFIRDTIIVVSLCCLSAFLSISTWTMFGGYLKTVLTNKTSIAIYHYIMAFLLVMIVVLFWMN